MNNVYRFNPLPMAPEYFVEDAPEERNELKIVRGLEGRGIEVYRQVKVRAATGEKGIIDIVCALDGKLYGWEVKQYQTGGPGLIADGIAQASDYAASTIADGPWQGQEMHFVFVGPAPDTTVEAYRYVDAEMLSRYTAPLGVGVFDQRMGVYAYGQPAIRFSRDGYRFCYNFNKTCKHKRSFRR